MDGIDLRVEPGEAIALLGPPGSGKSTLCLALAGLVPHHTGGRFGGRVELFGRDTRHLRPAELAGLTAIVFDEPESQLFNLTVEDEVAFGPESLALPPDEIRRRVGGALALVGLDVPLDRSPRALSGGQQQRLALAAAIALEPRLLVLDGPTAQLDPQGQQDFHAALGALRRERELTVVFVEPDPDLLAAHSGYADRIVVLHAGRIALDGTPDEVFGDPRRLHALGVAGPTLSDLASQIAELDAKPTTFWNLEGAVATLAPRLTRA